MVKIWRLLLILVLCSGYNTAFSQDVTLYQMDFLGQRHKLNPALGPITRFYFGVSNSVSVGSNSFVPDDLFVPILGSDSFMLSTRNLLNGMRDDNALRIDALNDLSIGVKINPKWFLFTGYHVNSNTRFNYPKDLFRFLLLGNAAPENLNQELDIGNFALNHTTYSDLSLGATYQPSCKLSVGLRIRRLHGLANLNTQSASIKVTTSDEIYQMTLSNELLFNYSYSSALDSDKIAPLQLLFSQNRGIGLDMGAKYTMLNDKLHISASLIDLGFINWTENATQISNKSQNREITFGGFNMNDFSSEDAAKDLVDSLESLFELDESSIGGYRTSLVSRFYTGAQYQFNSTFNAGVMYYGEIANQRLRSALSFNAGINLYKVLELRANASFMNRSLTNLGGGFAFNAGPMQFFVLTDNYSVALSPLNSNTIHYRVGFNWIFGYFKDKKNPCSPDYEAPKVSAPLPQNADSDQDVSTDNEPVDQSTEENDEVERDVEENDEENEDNEETEEEKEEENRL